MRLLVDTSAFFPLLSNNDVDHAAASRIWDWLREEKSLLFSTNYVLLESFALIQNRLGMAAVKDFQKIIVPLLEIEWVDEHLHQAGVAALLTADRRRLSLVDCTNFVVMRRLGLDTAFAFDQHFAQQGFTLAQVP
jgi:predicted nucleic acid-binding protein